MMHIKRVPHAWHFQRDDGKWPKFIQIEIDSATVHEAHLEGIQKLIISPHDFRRLHDLMNQIIIRGIEDTVLEDGMD